MPDIVDKAFDYTSYFINSANSVAQTGLDISMNTAQYSYESSKWIGSSVWNGVQGVYSSVKASLAENVNMRLSTQPTPPPPLTRLFFDVFANLIQENRYNIGIGITGPTIGYVGFKIFRHYVPLKRTANRLDSRYRYEVILVVGSINSTFVYKLVNDLNMKGFVVYVTVSDEEELKKVEEINDTDVRPLLVDYSNDSTVNTSLLKLARILDNTIENIPKQAYYHFKGALLIPNYTSLPKLKSLEQLNSREYIRITETFFLKLNTLLGNGLLSIIKESNTRKVKVEEHNGTKISGGFSKLLFINFMTTNKEDSRRLVQEISMGINKTFYSKVYDQYSPTLKETFYRLIGRTNNLSHIDIASLDILVHKRSNSTMISTSTILQRVLEKFSYRLTPADIHNKIYDLLNARMLMKNYRQEG